MQLTPNVTNKSIFHSFFFLHTVELGERDPPIVWFVIVRSSAHSVDSLAYEKRESRFLLVELNQRFYRSGYQLSNFIELPPLRRGGLRFDAHTWIHTHLHLAPRTTDPNQTWSMYRVRYTWKEIRGFPEYLTASSIDGQSTIQFVLRP